jgi:hypothetical protein
MLARPPFSADESSDTTNGTRHAASGRSTVGDG